MRRGAQLTLHLKQSKWKTTPKARTNCPVIGFPHASHNCSFLPLLVEV